MNLPELKDLTIYHQKVELIEETAKQIQKDFSLVDQNISFSGNTDTAYHELNTQIVPIVDRFLEINSSNFFALLYAIDIDEVQLKRVLFSNEFESPAAEISCMIIERELKKVIIRNHFKTLSDN